MRVQRIRDIADLLVFFTIRRLEPHLSPRNLYRLMAPLAFVCAALERLPVAPGYFAKSISPRAVRRARMRYVLSKVLEFLPDRLATPKWQARFRTTRLNQVQEARHRGRGVVLVGFHFGAFRLIPFWLRALGVPVIFLIRGSSEQRVPVKRMEDKLSPFPHLPTVLYNYDQLPSLIEALSAGHVVFLTADGETGKQVTLPIDKHWSFSMATGAIRLASHYGAELFPCSMIDEGEWHFRLEIGSPVPHECLNGSDLSGAAQHLLSKMLPQIQRHPEQSDHYLFNCFRPNPSSA